MMLPHWLLKGLEVSTYIMDIVDIVAILQGYSEHVDYFNKGKLVGKGAKILIQLYFEGVLDLMWQQMGKAKPSHHPSHDKNGIKI